MMNFTEYRKHFSKEIKWAGDKKIDLFNKPGHKYQKAFQHLEEYTRNLCIACRHLDLLSRKYPNQADISEKERYHAERLCFDVRFKQKEKLLEIIDNART